MGRWQEKRIDELERALRDIRDFTGDRKDGSWEDHGDEFRKIHSICVEALADNPNEPDARQKGTT